MRRFKSLTIFILILCLIHLHGESISFELSGDNRYEKYYRELVKQQNLQKIEKFNQDSAHHFKLKPNKFLDLKVEEFIALYASNNRHDSLQMMEVKGLATEGSNYNIHVKGQSEQGSNIESPSKEQLENQQLQKQYQKQGDSCISIDVDLSPWNSPVKDQGACNSCYAHSTVAVIEHLFCAELSYRLDLSQQNIADCTYDWAPPGYGIYNNLGCNGGWGWKAFHYVKFRGVALETSYPYISHLLLDVQKCQQESLEQKNSTKFKIEYYEFFYDNEDPQSQCEVLEDQLRKGNTVAVSIFAPPSFEYQFYGSETEGIDIFDDCQEYDTVNHEMQLVGATDRYWKLKNSYGVEWGEQGYMYLDRSRRLNCLNICMDFSFAYGPSIDYGSDDQ